MTTNQFQTELSIVIYVYPEKLKITMCTTRRESSVVLHLILIKFFLLISENIENIQILFADYESHQRQMDRFRNSSENQSKKTVGADECYVSFII